MRPAIVLLLLAATSLSAQEREYVLGAPSWTLAEPLTRAVGVAELRDGRVLLVDSREQLVQLASADGRALTQFGSQGDGPGEYRRPFALHRGRGDTLYIYDAGGRRYLRVTADGKLADDLIVPTALLMGGGLAPPRGIDASGAIYWQADVVGTENGAPKRNEFQNVRRWRPPAERLDTVARLRDHASALHAKPFHPFATRDAFVVARDGRIGVLSAEDYRLRWFRDGRLAGAGSPLGFDTVAVTAADRDELRRERAASPAGMARSSGGAPEGPSSEAVRRVAELMPDAIFPATMPPFVENGALLSPAEDLWVIRSVPRTERRSRVDVLAPDGKRRGWVRLPEGRRLVALTAAGVYLARVDDDGLEWIERYALPRDLR